MALPALLAVAAVVLYPLAFALLFSLREVRLNLSGRWVGLANYAALLGDREFLGALATTALFTLCSVALSLTAGLAVALALERPFRGRSAVLAVLVMPWVFPVVVTATVARAALVEPTGIASYWLQAAGLVEGPVLQNKTAVLVAAILADAWRGAPLVALFVLAGLSAIPRGVREAALVDGASAAQRLMLVTLPLLRPTLLVVLLYRALDALRVFDLFYVLGGRELGSLSTYVFTRVLRSGLFIGVGMAASVFAYVLALLLAVGFAALLVRAREATAAEGSGLDAGPPVGARPAGGAAASAAASYGVVALALAAALTPLLFVAKLSLSPPGELLAAPPALLPVSISFGSYAGLLGNPAFVQSLLNSAAIAGSTTLLVLLLAAPAAYALSRSRAGAADQLLLAAVLAVAFFPQVAVLTPLLVQLRALGLANSYWASVVPNTGFLLPLAVWFLASFFGGVPREVEEAARVDGASASQVLARVTLPLAAPGVLATGALVFVLAWNDFVFARTLIFDVGTQPVTVLLGDFVASLNAAEAYGLAAAGAVLAALPPVALVLAFGRRVAGGLSGGRRA
jgi:multiple sugar transport system permease protein